MSCVAPSIETTIAVPPVINATASRPPRFHIRTAGIILALIVCLPFLCALGLAGYFRLSSATQALRRSAMDSIPGQWHKRFNVHVGSFTLAVARFGSQFFNLPPEPKAALSALNAAEVGVYKLEDEPAPVNYCSVFVAADNVMRHRGWRRIVGVARLHQCVAVYVPLNLHSYRNIKACALVLNEHNLVVASVRGNLQPLLEFATHKLQQEHLPVRLYPGEP